MTIPDSADTETYPDLPYAVVCESERYGRCVVARHTLLSEAMHTKRNQDRSGGFRAEIVQHGRGVIVRAEERA